MSTLFFYDIIKTDFGLIRVVIKNEKLVRVDIEQSFSMSDETPDMVFDPEITEPFTNQMKSYISGKLENFDIPVLFSGTPFQNSVWKELVKIPFGQTRSYQEIAISLKNPHACRAVGSACGKNPVPIVVPCHRVITKSGTLGGFSCGLHVKKALMAIEGIKAP